MQSVKQTRTDASESYTGRIVLFFGTLGLLYFARNILIPLSFALILAFLLSPAVALLKRIGVPRAPGVVLSVVVTTASVLLTAWLITAQLVQVANRLPAYHRNIDRKLEWLQAHRSGPLGQAAQSLKAIGDEVARFPSAQMAPATPDQSLAVRIIAPEANQVTALWEMVQPLIGPLSWTAIVLIFAVFILVEKEDLRNRLLRLAGTGQLNAMTEAIDDAAARVSRYLSLQILVNLGFGTAVGIGLYFIGVPNPVLWGALAAIFRIVPWVGTIAVAVLPLGLALAVFDSWAPPILVFVLFTSLELVTVNLIEPVLYGAHTGVSSLALLVTTVFWGALWGPAGLILSTPLTVCAVVLGRYIPHLTFLHILLGDEEALLPAAQLYQRLLAMDHHDAHAVVDDFMRNSTLARLYDLVLVPALAMAEEDRHRAAIDSSREEFLFLNVNEMVAEFSEYRSPAEDRLTFPGRILCIPAHDQADEIAAAMLAQLLEQRGGAALSFPRGDLPGDMLALVGPRAGDLVCISAVPPYAFSPSIAMCRSIRERFPDVEVNVGIWGFGGDFEKAVARFEPAPPHRLFTGFGEVLEHVRAAGAAATS